MPGSGGTHSVPLTKLLGGGGLTAALLLLALTTTGATPLRKAATSSSAASAASATSAAFAPSATAAASAASTAAGDTSTSASTPTTTPTPSTASTTTSTAPASPTSALTPLASASAAAPARGRRSADRLEPTEWGLHLGIEKQYFAWRIMDYRIRLLVPARDCIFYENLTLPVFEQHLASQQEPATLFHGVRSFANTDVEIAASEEPDSDGAHEAAPDPPVLVTSSGIPEFIPLADAAPEDVRELPVALTLPTSQVSTLLAPEGDPDAPDIPTPRSYAEAIEDPYSSQWQAAMDAEMASWKSTGTYIDEVPPPGVNIVSGMWIFRVKRPPGSPPVFKARYVARGFSQRQGVDYFHTFSPTPKMTTLRVLLHVAAQRDYELHSLDFSTAFLQGSLHEEIWLRRPPGFTGSFPAGTQWSLRQPVYGLRQAPREWHDTLRTTLAALGFSPSTSDPSLFLRTDTLLPPFYILVSPGIEHGAPLP
ncbi:unnamed protein product [Closterium sp. NIES-54]